MNEIVGFLIPKLPALMQKTFQQVYLTVGAVLIAMLIGIPVSILIARKERLRNYVLGFTNILQTLPSLAVLGFLLPFFGIGVKTAIITLVLYSLLPIIRNTVTGILAISPEIREAAEGLGLTKFQKIRMVEFPLALPTIVAGIRIATAMGVGIATLAAFIGAGGLGDFIYEGLSLNNTPLILLGAIPAAILALLLDYLIAKIETVFSERKIRTKQYAIKFFGILTLLIALCIFVINHFYYSTSLHSENSIRIATKNFSEQFILGEILSQLIEAKTKLQVIRKFNLGGTLVCHQALLRGDIDVYPEYTGTAYQVILKQNRLRDVHSIYQYVKERYLKDFQIVWLEVFGFDNSNAVAIRQKWAIEKSVRTISDLMPYAKQLTIGVPADFMERPDGFLGLKQKYHLEFASVKLMDPGILYKAIQQQQIDAIMAFSTDGRIIAYHLVTLVDDKQLFPPYYAAPIIRLAFLDKHPEVKNVFNLLAGKINNKVMQDLNYQVDVLKYTPAEVAKKFLLKSGLISNQLN